MKNKINKNTIPNDFSIKLVLIDAFPVLFFGLSGIFLWLILNNFLFYIGATICMLSGIQRTLSSLINFLLYPLPLTFFIIGLISLLSMIIFTFVLDSSNAKSNWINQICNSLCQLSFFISFLIIFLMY